MMQRFKNPLGTDEQGTRNDEQDRRTTSSVPCSPVPCSSVQKKRSLNKERVIYNMRKNEYC